MLANTRNEDTIEDELEGFKAKVLSRIAPLWDRKAPGCREAIANATSLKILSDRVAELINRTRPEQGEVIQSRHDGTSTESSTVSIYRVLEANLMNDKAEIDAFLADLIIIEEERNM